MPTPSLDMGEYNSGQRLLVRYSPRATGADADSVPEADLELEIIHAYQPFSLSVICKVVIHPIAPTSSLPPGLPSTCIMKLFDRREAAHQRYLAETTREKPRSIWITRRARKRDGEYEAKIEEGCRRMMRNEMRAYEEMRELQGTHIPSLYGTIRYTSPVPPPSDTGELSDYRYTAHGRILEHIPSSTLRRYLEAAMRNEPPLYDNIRLVCDQAMALVHQIDGLNVLNRDARLENVLVSAVSKDDSKTFYSSPFPLQPHTAFRCTAIDFACTRLRYHDETDEEWRRAKEKLDEEGAIGCVMRVTLRNEGKLRDDPVDGERIWTYVPSRRWHQTLSKEEYEVYCEDDEWGLYAGKLAEEDRSVGGDASDESDEMDEGGREGGETLEARTKA